MNRPSLTIVVTAAAALAVTVAEAKAHLRVDWSEEDDYIEALVNAAIAKVEGETGLALVNRTLEANFADLCEVMELHTAPLVSVSSIKSLSDLLAETTHDLADWSVITSAVPGQVRLKDSATLPSVTLARRPDAVKVRFVAGHGSDGSAVPVLAKHAIKLLVGHWFRFREPVESGVSVANVPESYTALVNQLRIPLLP